MPDPTPKKEARFQFTMGKGKHPKHFAAVTMEEILSPMNPDEPGTIRYTTEIYEDATENEPLLLFAIPIHCDPDICRELVRVYNAGFNHGERAADSIKGVPKEVQKKIIAALNDFARLDRTLDLLALATGATIIKEGEYPNISLEENNS